MATPETPNAAANELRVSALGKLAYAVMILAVLVLSLTGILTFVTGHAPMTHWILMLHVSAAPVFAIALAFVALTWSDRSRLRDARTPYSNVTKALLWFILACGLLVILTGVLPMTPLYGTDGQHFLYLTHRYSGITLACAVILHLLNLRRAR